MDRVLEQPGFVAHGQQILGLYLWRSGPIVRWYAMAAPRYDTEAMGSPRMLESGQVPLCGSLPCHRSAAGIGALAQGLPTSIVGQQSADLPADGHGIAEGNQNAAPVG